LDSTGEQFPAVGIRQAELLSQDFDGLTEGVFLAISSQFQQRKHETLVVGNGHWYLLPRLCCVCSELAASLRTPSCAEHIVLHRGTRVKRSMAIEATDAQVLRLRAKWVN
jgi:hypothetical protein